MFDSELFCVINVFVFHQWIFEYMGAFIVNYVTNQSMQYAFSLRLPIVVNLFQHKQFQKNIWRRNVDGGWFGHYKMMPKTLKNDWNPGIVGAHLRVLGISYWMNTNMTGLIWFSLICFNTSLRPCAALDKSSLGIGRVKSMRIT